MPKPAGGDLRRRTHGGVEASQCRLVTESESPGGCSTYRFELISILLLYLYAQKHLHLFQGYLLLWIQASMVCYTDEISVSESEGARSVRWCDAM